MYVFGVYHMYHYVNWCVCEMCVCVNVNMMKTFVYEYTYVLRHYCYVLRHYWLFICHLQLIFSIHTSTIALSSSGRCGGCGGVSIREHQRTIKVRARDDTWLLQPRLTIHLIIIKKSK